MFNRVKLQTGVILFILFSLLTTVSAQGLQQNDNSPQNISQGKGGGPKYASDRIIVKFKSHVTPDDVAFRRLQGIERLNIKFGFPDYTQMFPKEMKDDQLDQLKEAYGLTRIHLLKVPKGTDIEQMVGLHP